MQLLFDVEDTFPVWMGEIWFVPMQMIAMRLIVEVIFLVCQPKLRFAIYFKAGVVLLYIFFVGSVALT